MWYYIIADLFRRNKAHHAADGCFPFYFTVKGVGNMEMSFSDVILLLNLIVNIISLTYNLTKKK